MMWIIATVLLSSVLQASRLLQQADPAPLNLCDRQYNCGGYLDGCQTCGCRMTAEGRIAECTPNTDNACNPGPQSCTSCSYGYTLNVIAGECHPGCGDIPYCARYMKDTCNSCDCPNFSLSCGSLAACEPEPISGHKCIECMDGFILNEEINGCEVDPLWPPPLIIENCKGARAKNYRAKILNVPYGMSLSWVKMKDSSGDNEYFLKGEYDDKDGCYEWYHLGEYPYELPLHFKVKAKDNDKVIKTKKVIYSFDEGDQGDMNDNFYDVNGGDGGAESAMSQSELNSDPLSTSSHNNNDNKLNLLILILIISSIVLVVVIMVMVFLYIYCVKTRRGKEKQDDNKMNENQMEVEASCDTQTNQML